MVSRPSLSRVRSAGGVFTPYGLTSFGRRIMKALMIEKVILLAEDDVNDIALIRRAFDKGGISSPLMAVLDGEQAIAYLSGIGKYSNRNEYPLPDLMLL